MILLIDTTDRFTIKLGLISKDWIPDVGLPSGSRMTESFETKSQSVDLLPNIDRYLNNNKLSLKDLTAILVNRGPGSFTGVRVGVTTANALAWSLNIPVFGYIENEA